ncbi:MAG: hypothetical protein IPP66_15310 [Anaerolineales bacterium]|nr:hypothetical protein [Anaerolineales bacterium]
MNAQLKRFILFIGLILVLVLAGFSLPAREVVVNGQPGGFISIPFATLIDQKGQEYGFTLIAREAEDSAGVGNVTLQLLGPSISICSTHGGSVDIGTSEDGENFGGNFPLQEIQCGTAYGMAVSVDGCKVKTEMHGYSHTDFPLYTYTGSSTIEVTLRKNNSGGDVDLKLYTPKGPIKLSGYLNDPIEMDTCP